MSFPRSGGCGRARAWACAFALVLLAGCDVLYHDAAPAPGTLLLEYAVDAPDQQLVVAGGIAGAFAEVNQVHVRITDDSGTTVLDDVVPVSADEGEIRTQLQVELADEAASFSLEVELLQGDAALFRASGQITLSPGTVARPELPLDPVPAGVAISPLPSPLRAIGATTVLEAAVVFATGHEIPGRAVEWRSRAPDVVSVSSSGMVTALNAGTAVVEGSHGAAVGEVPVEVAPEPAEIEVSPAQAQVPVDGTVQLQATVRDAGGTPFTATVQWISTDPSVASVDDDGLVTGESEGPAVVTARAGEVEAESAISVVPPVPIVSTVGATSIGTRSARIRGNVTPVESLTRVWFEWGLGAGLTDPATTQESSLEPGEEPVLVGHDLRDLTPATTYYFRVVAANGAGEARGNVLSFTTGIEVPAPTNVGVDLYEMGGYPAVYFDYDVESYPDAVFQVQVRRISPETTDWETVATGTSTWIVLDNPITAEILYGFRVRACRGSACSAWSEVAEVTGTGASPSVETRPAIDHGAGTSAHLRARVWDGGHDATYRFEWADNDDFVGATTTPSRTVSRTAYAVLDDPEIAAQSGGPALEEEHYVEEFLTGLTPGREYYYRVAVQNPDGSDSGFSRSFTAGTEPVRPGELTLLESGYVWGNWDYDGDPELGEVPDFFEVERREGSGDWKLWGDVETSDFFDFDVTPGVNYSYRVRACWDFGGCSDPSNVASITVTASLGSPPSSSFDLPPPGPGPDP